MKTILIITIVILILIIIGLNNYRKMYKRMYNHQKKIVSILRERLGEKLTPKEKEHEGFNS